MQPENQLAPYADATRRHSLLANLVVVLGYLLGGWMGLRISGAQATVADLWPPAALTLVATLLCSVRVLPGAALGAAIFGVISTGSIVVALCVALGAALEAWLGYQVLRLIPGFSVRLTNARSVVALLGTSALTPFVAAAIGALGLWSAGIVNTPSLGRTISCWWIGDALAILIFAPVILSWWGNPRIDLSSARARAPYWLLIMTGVVSFGVLCGRLDWVIGSTSSLYLLFPFIMLLSLSDNMPLCSVANVMVMGFALWGAGTGHGPFAGRDIIDLQLFLAALSMTTLLVVALSREKTLALTQARRNLDRFRSLTTLSADWYWESDSEHRFTFLSDRYEEKSGLRLADALGRARYDMPVNAFESEAHKQRHIDDLNRHESFHDLLLKRVGVDGRTRWATVSGEPVFTEHGQFEGYRGVGRDITTSKQDTLRIEESQRFLEALINAIITPVLVKDDSHHYIAANAAFTDFFSRPMAEILGKTDYDYFNADQAEYFQRTDDAALREGTAEYESSYPIKGRTYCMHVRKSSATLPDGRRIVVLVMLDVTDRKAVETRLRESEERFRDFAQAAGDFAFETDLEGRFTYCSSRGMPIWGYAVDELIGHTPIEFMSAEEGARVREWLRENLRSDGSFRDLQHHVVTKQGEERWFLVNAIGTFDTEGNRIGQRGSARDITDRKSVEDRINFLATRDALTGLPNRVLFGDRITQAIAAARRTGQMVALFFMDLDRFKHINDSLGHDVGDALLKQVSERMLACVRKRDTLARLGGDEFVLTLEGLQQAEDVAQVAGKIIRAIAQPFDIAGHSLSTSCSIGISIFPSDADDDRTLMKNADTAMYHAKERGRNNFQFFSSDMNTRALERSATELALRKAVTQENFLLHFQPTVNLRSNHIIGVEALLRWVHPEKGLLTPSHFIDVAEDCGLISSIGQWVLREACRCVKGWDEAGYPALGVSVNISSRQLLKPSEFVRSVTRILGETGLDPKRLELEVTESILLHNHDEILQSLRKLAREGIRLSVDDFGTGYTSLSYLRQFPIESVKIDRSFVRDVDTNAEHGSVIQAIVAMGHSLGLTIIAEGVETRAQLTVLSKLGCDAYQGNLFSKPLPPVDIAARYLAPGELDLQIVEP